MNKFHISAEVFQSWAKDIEKIFPGEYCNVWYTPYRSERREVIQADGSKITKRIKIDASGILYDHYDYTLRVLRQQNLVQSEELPSDQIVPLITDDSRNSAEWLQTHVGPPDLVQQHWDTSRSVRTLQLNQGTSVVEYYNNFPVLKNQLGADLVKYI
ncbi:uncharacterized protein [Chelonus insularis]|uniref:uncharacterized protein n=1 Tax=Chelonus insularis TaxID=460826 RepID=UPI00158C5062|nr:uncharacterized protein LOC118067074 [Chelonus insularis]XP_034946146.1 uncharacterized protein LOC118071214 [Chelonus insularis]